MKGNFSYTLVYKEMRLLRALTRGGGWGYLMTEKPQDYCRFLFN